MRTSRRQFLPFVLGLMSVVGVCLGGVGVAGAVTEHSGTISANDTWGGPETHVLTENVTVASGVTLTISPGTVIKAQGGQRRLVVEGTLRAIGTSGSPIYFTSYSDDNVGGDTDGNPGQGARNDWAGIEFTNISADYSPATPAVGSLMQYCVVRYGGDYAWNVPTGLVRCADSAPGLRDCTFTDGGFGAIQVTSAATPYIQNCRANNNAYNGICVTWATLSADSTWTNRGLPWVVTQDAAVAEPATLTIEAGAVVKCTDNTDLVVQGKLRAAGTAASNIIFTSLRDDNIGGDTDSANEQPQPNNWGGIRFGGSASDNPTGTGTGCLLDYCQILYGGTSGWNQPTPLVHCLDAAPALRHCTFGYGGYSAVGVAGPSTPYVDTCSSNNCQLNGITVNYTALSGNSTWTACGLPWVVDGDMTVSSNMTLTIQAGTVVKFNRESDLYIAGTIRAVGTLTKNITFTATSDDEILGDTDSSLNPPVAQNWGGIHFTGSSVDYNATSGLGCLLQYCRVRYGGNGSWGNRENLVECVEASPGFLSCRLSNCEQAGLYVSGGTSKPTIKNNVFTDLTRGLECVNCDPSIQNCTFSATTEAAVKLTKSSASFRNCIIALNTGSGMMALDNAGKSPEVLYSCFYGNTSLFEGMSTPTSTTNMFSKDPLFVDPGRDYHLKSQYGHWNGTAFVNDAVSSPCLYGGDPTTPYSNEPQPNGARANMGFEGNTAEASRSSLYAYKPDLMISSQGQTSYIGDDAYNTTGDGQLRSQVVAGAASATFVLKLQNDSATTDSFRVKGFVGGSGWTVKYLDGATGTTDITSSVTSAAGWLVGPLAKGATRQFRVVVAAGTTVAANAVKNGLVTVTSQSDGAKTDTVKASTKKGPALIKVATPANNAIDASRWGPITVEFSQPVQQASAQSHFDLRGTDNVLVKGRFTWLTERLKLSFVPLTPLKPSIKYTAKITTGVTADDGHTLSWGEQFAFTTGRRAVVAAMSPQGFSAYRTSNIVVTFSQAMNKTVTQAALTINGVKAATFGGAFTWSTDSKNMTFNPTRTLSEGTDYTVKVAGTAIPTASSLTTKYDFSWTFTTQAVVPLSLGGVAAAGTSGGGASVTLSLSSEADVQLEIANMAGRVVSVLPAQSLSRGLNTLVWTGRSNTGSAVPSGTYLVRIMARSSGGAQATQMVPCRIVR